MALSKDKKQEVVSELSDLFKSSKMTVVAKYQGITVKSLQQLRREARANGTTIKVVKNRLVKKALESSDAHKGVDMSALKDMLLYAFNDSDEVAGANVLNSFAKKESALEFVGAFSAEGVFVSAQDVKALANLPSKPQLIGGIINTLQSPTRTVVGQLKGNLLGLLDAVATKAS
jgi:large subunit ribosomal protein L10